MSPDFRERDLDGELVFDRNLGDGATLDVLQELLGRLAPKWCSKLRLWREAKDQRPIPIDNPGALKAAVIDAAAERGSTYQELASSS